MSRLEARVMQDIREVLRSKEEQLEQLQKEIEALRTSLRILEKDEAPPKMGSRSVETIVPKDSGTKPPGNLKRFP